ERHRHRYRLDAEAGIDAPVDDWNVIVRPGTAHAAVSGSETVPVPVTFTVPQGTPLTSAVIVPGVDVTDVGTSTKTGTPIGTPAVGIAGTVAPAAAPAPVPAPVPTPPAPAPVVAVAPT